MTGYDIFLSNGSLLTTVNVKTIDNQQNTSLFLIGQGIPNYGTDIAQDFVWMLENFAKTSPPVNPLVGQEWYDLNSGHMKFWNGTAWHSFMSLETVADGLLTTHLNVDFTVSGTTVLFTGANAALDYFPARMILVPAGPFNATVFPTISLTVATTGDVLNAYTVPTISDDKFITKAFGSTPTFIPGSGGTLSLNITTPASSGQLAFDVYIFGAAL